VLSPVPERVARFGRTRGRPLGAVAAVLSRSDRRVIGILRSTPTGRVLDPEDPRWRRTMEVVGACPAADGTPAVAALRPLDTENPGHVAVDVIATFPATGRIEVEFDRLLVRDGLSVAFPAEVEAEAAGITAEGLLRGDLRDLTAIPFVTIDPEDARDHDDAVAAVPVEGGAGGTDLWVAIADVAEAVAAGSAIDREARARGLSVYLPDRVARMLPDRISAEACSLREGRDRAALVVRMRLGPDGKVRKEAELSRGVIRSRGFLAYGPAAAVIAAREGAGAGSEAAGAPEVTPEVADSLVRAVRAARALRSARLAAGALDLEIPELRVVLDGRGGVSDLLRRAAEPVEREAWRLVEEFMLAANRAVASLLLRRRLPGIYRVHEPPDAEDVLAFAEVARRYGVPVASDRPQDPRTLSRALTAMRDRPWAEGLASLALRALKQARYANANLGHFGLAFGEYLHFTSPIRRYPDLVVHRVLRAHLAGVPAADIREWARGERFAEAAADASAAERRGMLLEREVGDLCGAWMLRDRVGGRFDGVVVGVGTAGLYVRLDSPAAEGLLAIEDLPGDDWRVSMAERRVRGRLSGRQIGLGDRLAVTVLDASVARRRVYLGLDEGARGRRATGS
jgi:ribonuclease R